MSEQTNSTPENTTEDAVQGQARNAQRAERPATSESVTTARPSPQTGSSQFSGRSAPQATRNNRRQAAADDYDEDDNYDDYEDEYADDDEESDEIREVVTSGPADYTPSTQRGRSRRINNDIKIDDINYKNVSILNRFLDPRGRILSRRKTGVSAKVQRRAVKAIKLARHMALLPYTAEQTRITRLHRRSR